MKLTKDIINTHLESLNEWKHFNFQNHNGIICTMYLKPSGQIKIVFDGEEFETDDMDKALRIWENPSLLKDESFMEIENEPLFN